MRCPTRSGTALVPSSMPYQLSPASPTRTSPTPTPPTLEPSMSTSLLPDHTATATTVGQVLSIADLVVSVHGSRLGAVLGASLTVGRGESVGLVGESGSGKTLTCRAALGVLAPGCAVESGTITFAGEDVTQLTPREWTRIHG